MEDSRKGSLIAEPRGHLIRLTHRGELNALRIRAAWGEEKNVTVFIWGSRPETQRSRGLKAGLPNLTSGNDLLLHVKLKKNQM